MIVCSLPIWLIWDFSLAIAHINSVKISKSTGKNGRQVKWGSSCWDQRCFQGKAVEGLLIQYNSCSWLKTAASNWYLHGLVIEKSNFINLKIKY